MTSHHQILEWRLVCRSPECRHWSRIEEVRVSESVIGCSALEPCDDYHRQLLRARWKALISGQRAVEVAWAKAGSVWSGGGQLVAPVTEQRSSSDPTYREMGPRNECNDVLMRLVLTLFLPQISPVPPSSQPQLLVQPSPSTRVVQGRRCGPFPSFPCSYSCRRFEASLQASVCFCAYFFVAETLP